MSTWVLIVLFFSNLKKFLISGNVPSAGIGIDFSNIAVLSFCLGTGSILTGEEEFLLEKYPFFQFLAFLLWAYMFF